MHYERGLHIHSSSHALRTRTQHTLVKSCITTRTPHTLVKSCITNEDSTYTRKVMHYERGLHIHSSSHALRTRTPHTLVKSCITNEDSTYTRPSHALRTSGLHMYTLVKSLRTRTHLVKSYTRQVSIIHMYILVITNEDSTCHALRKDSCRDSCIMHERGLHIHSSSSCHTLRTPRRTPRRLHMYILVKSCITHEDSTCTSPLVKSYINTRTLGGLHITNEDSHTLVKH